MIIFQIISGILLVPLTVLALILFNLYLTHWIYLLFVLFFGLIYALLCGSVFVNSSVAVWVFMTLALLYIIRMSYIVCRLDAKNNDKNYPLVRGNMRSKEHKFRMVFLFPLSFLNVFKLLPSFIRRELTRKMRLDIEIHKLTDLILDYSIGTRVEVISDDADIYFEIK